MELFDFFLESYLQTSKERLLEFMVGAADFEQLSKLNQKDLAEVYCERLVKAAMAQDPASQ